MYLGKASVRCPCENEDAKKDRGRATMVAAEREEMHGWLRQRWCGVYRRSTS